METPKQKTPRNNDPINELPFFLQVSQLLDQPIGVKALTQFFRQCDGQSPHTIVALMAKQAEVCWQRLATLVLMLETEQTLPLTLMDTTETIPSLVPYYRAFVEDCGPFLTTQVLRHYPNQSLTQIDFQSFWSTEGLRHGFLRLAIVLMHYNCARVEACYQYLLNATIRVPGALAKTLGSGPPPTQTFVLQLHNQLQWLDLQLKLDRLMSDIPSNGRLVCRVGRWPKERLLRFLNQVQRFRVIYQKRVTVELVVPLWQTNVLELLTIPIRLHILVPSTFATQLAHDGSFTLFTDPLPLSLIPVMQNQHSVDQKIVAARDLWQELVDRNAFGSTTLWSAERLGQATPTTIQVLQGTRQLDPLVVDVQSCFRTVEDWFDFRAWEQLMNLVATIQHPGGVQLVGLAALSTHRHFTQWHFHILETAVYCLWPQSELTSTVPRLANHWPEIYQKGRIGKRRWQMRVHVDGWRRVLLGTDWRDHLTPLFCTFPCQTAQTFKNAHEQKAAFLTAVDQQQLILN